jgi:hypothetical protein
MKKEDIGFVTVEMIEAYIASRPRKETPSPPSRTLSRDAAQRTDARTLLDEALGKIGELGGRNHAGFYLACQLRDEGYGEGEAEATMLDFAASVPDPGTYSDGEALKAMRQAYRETPREPRAQPGRNASYEAYDGFGPSPSSPSFADFENAAKRSHNAWPYAVDSGQIVFLQEKRRKDGIDIEATPVADFVATITAEITDEHGERLFTIEGEGKRGKHFSVDVEAEIFGEDRRLRAILEAAAGAMDPVRAGMTGHLGPAIKLLTQFEDLEQVRLYHRTGWDGDRRFLLPGREVEGVRIDVADKLPYAYVKWTPEDLTQGLSVLDALIRAFRPEVTTIPLAMLFQAPAAQPAGWTNERYAVFIQGRTGSLKTSFAQVAMCLFGEGFLHDERLIKLGQGATTNAVMRFATQCHDLPILIDNFKLNTGLGAKDLISVIHNLMEGGEKDRLNRASELKESRSLRCWPLFTGEDIPDTDPASLARILIVGLDWQRGTPNPLLTQVQEEAGSLAAVGAAWVDWLATEGWEVAERVGRQMPAYRQRWADTLRRSYPDAANILRVATNLATNELAWELVCLHPTIGQITSRYTAQHKAGLLELAHSMGRETSDALEGQIVVNALRDLISTGQNVLVERSREAMDFEKDRMIGWKDDEGVYLIMNVALRAVKGLLGYSHVMPSNRVLYSQLAEMGLIASSGTDTQTTYIWVQGRSQRVLHLHKEKFFEGLGKQANVAEDLGL